MFQSITDFKIGYLLKIKYILTSKETLELLSNVQILTSNEIQLSQKHQLHLSRSKATRFGVLYFTSSLKKYEKRALLSRQSNCSPFCVLMIRYN